MQIVARNRIREIEEHDKVLGRLLAQRSHERQNLQGIRRWIARIKIEIWAWRETSKEQWRNRQNDSPHDV